MLKVHVLVSPLVPPLHVGILSFSPPFPPPLSLSLSLSRCLHLAKYDVNINLMNNFNFLHTCIIYIFINDCVYIDHVSL